MGVGDPKDCICKYTVQDGKNAYTSITTVGLESVIDAAAN